MFRSDPLPPPVPAANLFALFGAMDGVVDAERGYVLRSVGVRAAVGYGEPHDRWHGWLLEHGDVRIPFEVFERDTGDRARCLQMTMAPWFGASVTASVISRVPAHVFADDAERDRYLMVAIEAVLVYWNNRQSGLDFAPQVRGLGRVWTPYDFGYDPPSRRLDH